MWSSDQFIFQAFEKKTKSGKFSKFGTSLYFIHILTWGLGFYRIQPVEDLRHASPSVRPESYK